MRSTRTRTRDIRKIGQEHEIRACGSFIRAPIRNSANGSAHEQAAYPLAILRSQASNVPAVRHYTKRIPTQAQVSQKGETRRTATREQRQRGVTARVGLASHGPQRHRPMVRTNESQTEYALTAGSRCRHQRPSLGAAGASKAAKQKRPGHAPHRLCAHYLVAGFVPRRLASVVVWK